MLNKLQLNSLATSILLVPIIALNACEANVYSLDFIFNIFNSLTNHSVSELQISSNNYHDSEEHLFVKDILANN